MMNTRTPPPSATAPVSTPRGRANDRSRRALRGWVTAHPVAAYALLAYAISWSLWSPAVAGGGGAVVVALFFLGVLGPAASAVIVSRAIGAPLRPWAARIVKWRVPIRYYLYALGLPALLFTIVNLELALLGQDVELGLLGERLPAYLATFVMVLVLGGGLEEPGWRGFALPRLQEHHTPVKATLILGVVWGIWHLPLYGLAFVGPCCSSSSTPGSTTGPAACCCASCCTRASPPHSTTSSCAATASPSTSPCWPPS